MPPLPPIDGVDEALRRDGHHDQRHPAQPDRRRERRCLEHGLVTDRDQWVPALESESGQAAGRATPGSRAPWRVRRPGAPRCPRRSRRRRAMPTAASACARLRGEVTTTPRRTASLPSTWARLRRRMPSPSSIDPSWSAARRTSVPLSTGSPSTGSMRSIVAAIEPEPSIAGAGRVVRLVLGEMARRCTAEDHRGSRGRPVGRPAAARRAGPTGTSSQTTCRPRKSRARSAVSATIRSAAITRRRVGPASGSPPRRSARNDIRSPGRIAGEVHESGASAFGQRPPDTSRTTARCPDQHGFHRSRTMPRRPPPCGPRPCRHRPRNPLDRRLRFRKIGPCPTLWNGSAHRCPPISSRGWRPET